MAEEQPKKELALGQHVGEIRQEDRRVENVTIIKDDDPDFLEECKLDNLEEFLDGTKIANIKITIATPEDDHPRVQKFAETLEGVIPNAVFERRDENQFEVYRKKQYEGGITDLLLITSLNQEVYSMYHIHLPDGPTLLWRVTSIAHPDEIEGMGQRTPHYPEVFTKRFETLLGRRCARSLRALFPATPELEGRQVVAFHQQRDFVFFRSYRYIFESKEKVRTQELGPRFTLKLLWMQDGPYNPSSGQYTFYRRTRHDSTRRTWWL
jgi:ribosome production factor 1